MKFKLKQEVFSLVIIAVVILSSLYFYSIFPETVAIHWNSKGEVDGWGSKFFGAFFIPLLLLGLYGMFLTLPKIDPKKDRYQEFGRAYKIFQNMIILFLAIIYYITAINAIGYEINVAKVVPVLVGLLFVVIGNYLGKLRRNWFVGIKTPWTLSSENVWNKTHRFGGWVFIFGGLSLTGIAYLPSPFVLYFFVADILFLAISPVLYSYSIFKKEEKKSPNKEDITLCKK